MKDARKVFEGYAQRGLFRGYSEPHPGDFRFRWLWDLPFRVTEKNGALTFHDVLPNVRKGSKIEAGLREFMAGRARMSTHQGTVSLKFQVANAADVRAAIELISDVFLTHLNLEHPLYVAEHLNKQQGFTQ